MMEDDQDSEGTEKVAPYGRFSRQRTPGFKLPNMKESAAEEDMALGGHMSSAYDQSNRDFSIKKLKSKTKSFPSHILDGDQIE